MFVRRFKSRFKVMVNDDTETTKGTRSVTATPGSTDSPINSIKLEFKDKLLKKGWVRSHPLYDGVDTQNYDLLQGVAMQAWEDTWGGQEPRSV